MTAPPCSRPRSRACTHAVSFRRTDIGRPVARPGQAMRRMLEHAREQPTVGHSCGGATNLNFTAAPRSAQDRRADAIRADLIGDTTAIAAGITARGRAPVLALCRMLIEAGHDPGLALESFRGDVLCLRLRSIGVAGRLTVDESRDCRFVRFRRNGHQTPDLAPPMRHERVVE
jgi:hypothetical protein